MVNDAEKTKVMIITAGQKWTHLHIADTDTREINKMVDLDRVLGHYVHHRLTYNAPMQNIHSAIACYLPVISAPLKEDILLQLHSTTCRLLQHVLGQH